VAGDLDANPYLRSQSRFPGPMVSAGSVLVINTPLTVF
jgi:hypothetical protein